MILLKRPIVLLIALIVIITLIAAPTITYPLGRDQGEFATIARGILDGRIPYVDLWNPKPPAIFYVYAAAMRLFGRTSEALRVIDLLIFPPIAATLYWIGKRLANVRVGLWAALLFGVFYFSETFWTLTQNDGIVLLPMVFAIASAIKSADLRPSDRPSLPVKAPVSATSKSALWAFASGALTVYTIWYKYPFALMIGVVVFAYLWARRLSPSLNSGRRQADLGLVSRGEVFVDILAFSLGGLLIGIGGIAYMMSIGAWDALVQSALVTASYTVLGLSDVVSALQLSLGFRVQLWGALFLLALIGLIFAIRRFNRRSLWIIVAVWLIAASAMMLVQLKFYDYHWLPMLPPLVLIGAGVIEALIGLIPLPLLTKSGLASPLPLTERGEKNGAQAPSPRLRGRGDLGVRGLIALTLLAALTAVIASRTLPYLTGREDQRTYYHQFQAGEFVADESLEVANFLRAHVAPGDSLFIWGFRPEVYYLSQLNPAVRFIFQFPLVAKWYPPEWRQQTVDILWAALPPYVLVLQVDYMPWVTGNDEDSNTDLQGYTELNNWLEFNYVQDSQIGNFILWRRTSSIPK